MRLKVFAIHARNATRNVGTAVATQRQLPLINYPCHATSLCRPEWFRENSGEGNKDICRWKSAATKMRLVGTTVARNIPEEQTAGFGW